MSDTALAGSSLARLRELVATEGEALAPALAETIGAEVLEPLVTASAAAAATADAGERALVMESVLEGYLLHFGQARLVETADDDLRLLAGDYMYALGLSRLAALGDLVAVRALADLITLSARHHAEGRPPVDLAAPWCLAAMTVAAGEGREEVSARAADLGVALEAQAALIAFRQVAFRKPQG